MYFGTDGAYGIMSNIIGKSSVRGGSVGYDPCMKSKSSRLTPLLRLDPISITIIHQA